jgi:hypothetical protein
MSTIRPPVIQTPVQPAPFSAARTAQLAFFRAAVDRVQGQELRAGPATAAAAGGEPDTAAPAERYARPGALVDIRV